MQTLSVQNEQIEVTISNLPNQTKQPQIIEYLETAGPIKSYKFSKDEARYSVVIIYYSIQAADICRKYLSQRYFKGRELKITFDNKKLTMLHQSNPLNNLNDEQILAKQIVNLRNDQKRILLGMLRKLRLQQGRMFEQFLANKHRIVTALLYTQ